MKNSGIFLLSIGDELLDGRTQNTNASYFGEQLRLRGIPVHEVRCVSDRLPDIKKALREAAKFPLVIVTGGLGPTNDDRTVEGAALAFQRKIIRTKESLEHVKSRYEKRGLPLTETRLRLALVPARSKIIPNPTGTAPGLYLKEKKSSLFFLPGVPSECRPMFDKEILPLAEKKLAQKRLVQRNFWRSFGKGESVVYQSIEALIKPFEEKYPDTFVLGVHISFPCIDITAELWDIKGKKKPKEAEFAALCEQITENLGSIVFTRARESLADVVCRALATKKLTLATAESCTGGLLGKVLTDISGSSAYYPGGVVSYANEAKETLLGVARSTLENHGAVSAATVCAMAEGVRKKMNSDYALAISGIAGPSGGTQEKPVGTTYVALSSASGTKSFHQIILNAKGTREQNRQIAVHLALDALRLELMAQN